FFYGRGDGLSHLGLLQNTLNRGHLAIDDLYPAREMIQASLAYFTMITPRFLELSVPGISPFLGMPFFYLLARAALGSSRQALLAMLIVSAATFGITSSRFSPQDMGNLLTVLFIFLYMRFRWQPETNGRVLLVLFSLVIPIIHPFTATIIILALVAMELMGFIFKDSLKTLHIMSENKPQISLNLAIITTIVYLLWTFYHTYLLGVLGQTAQYLVGKQISQSLMQEYSIAIEKYQINVFSIGARIYGHTIYYGILALIGMFFYVRRLPPKTTPDRNSLMLIAYAAVPAAITIIQLLVQLWRINPGRAATLVELIFPVFGAMALLGIFKNKLKSPLNRRRVMMFCLISLILIAPIVNEVLFAIHLTPLRSWPGEQVTRQEYAGLGWFFSKRDNSIGIKEIGIRHFRFASLFPGAIASGWYLSPELEVKDHFGYDYLLRTGDDYERDSYILTSEYDWQVQMVLFNRLHRFTPEDFNKIDNDSSVMKIYTASREMEVRYVKALARY
ncbi:MAG: hypothetical protein HW384_1, partial [Dehalococcoidia bacterium]|nr:hypothetical protein [Dehalococcoidia bacterium]